MRTRAATIASLLNAGALAGVACAGAAAHAAEEDHVHASLISEHRSFVPGQSLQIALRLQHDEGWHTYWINPGDSGLPTKVAWSLPPGFKAQDIAWPLPERFDVGGFYNFGYTGEVVLPVVVHVPDDAKPGTTAHVAASVKWLVCREECIPGTAQLALDVPIEKGPSDADPRWIGQFARARLSQPQPAAWHGEASVHDGRVTITLHGADLPAARQLRDAFVVERRIVDNKPPVLRRDGDALIVDCGESDYFGDPPKTVDVVITAASDSVVGIAGWRASVPVSVTAAH